MQTVDAVRVAWGDAGLEEVAPRLTARLDAAFVSRAARGEVGLPDVARLAVVDPQTLDGARRVDLIQAWERVRAQVDGIQQLALAAVIDSTEALGLEGEEARHEVGAALRLSPGTAYDRTKVAAVLTRRLPATLAQLQAGRISYPQARLLADAIHELPTDTTNETVADIEARVLADAPDQTVAQTRRTVTRAAIAADPHGAQQRARKASAARAIRRHVLPDAMMGWWLTMPAAAEAAAWTALTAKARATQTELRAGAGTDPGLDALRVDTLLDALLNTAGYVVPDTSNQHDTTPVGPFGPAAPAEDEGPHITCGDTVEEPRRVPRCRCGGTQTAAVVIDLPTLLGLADNPGEIPGYGPVPPELARTLAADRDWTRWTTEPTTGHLLDRCARTYRPSDRMRRHIAATHRHCTFPGCHRPAEQCDTDHRVTFRSGGDTVVINLGPLCRQHHNAKTHGRWRLRYDPGTATTTWTSPLGHTYTTGADPPLP